MTDGTLVWMAVIGMLVAGLLVFSICYFFLRQFFNNRLHMAEVEMQKKSLDQTLPLKLQAYERLTLLFERIHVPTLIAKFKRNKMSSGELQASLMVAIQQEFEHNVTQQIYVSDKLWKVIVAAKQELFNQIDRVMLDVAYSEDGDVYSKALIEHFSDADKDPSRKAIFAIKQEAKLLVR